jgi:hypothetical protein
VNVRHEWDVPLSLELRSDLTMQRLLIRFHCQEEVGPLLLELPKNGRWVWSASAWIRTPPDPARRAAAAAPPARGFRR